MRNLLFKTRVVVFLLFSCYLLGCEEECPPPEPTGEQELKVEVVVNNLYRADAGAGGIVNSAYKEFDYVEITQRNNGTYGMQIMQFEWYQNSVWAARENISIVNLELNQNSKDDTIFIDKQPIITDNPRAFINHIYFDGDAAAECYEIDEEAEERSWLRIIDYNGDTEVLTGELNLLMEISEECPPKYDETQPDYIKVEDFYFRAKLRE